MDNQASRPALIEYLPWDSSHFGRRIARLQERRLTPAVLTNALLWCRAGEIDCLYYLADARDGSSARLAERNAFRLTDIRMTFWRRVDCEGGIESVPAELTVRLASAADLGALKTIAARSFVDSRFYYDDNFARSNCDDLYSIWIERSLESNPAGVLVVDNISGQPSGFITCDVSGVGQGQIGLIAVDESARGMGIGRVLVLAAISWFASRGVPEVEVVTQGRNCAAQRMYQRAGFVTSSMDLWFHRWFDHS